ncbi:cobalt-precorrin 5A hydrolase [Butyricicoccus sp.]|uniref:cobalt-precorrin 5A hydrolase n=1 Tax=Butyricicoccus sp. TaxID=2049021 RepID=UPI003F139723
MNISIISFTDRGRALSTRIAACLPDDCVKQYAKAEGFAAYESVHAFAARAMAEDSAVIFVGAVGIAVRAVAPFVRGKDIDPAVLAVDENGRFVIPVLSGHIGGANRLAEQLAEQLHAIPVITTATDGRGIFAADSWAVQHDCVVADTGCIKYISGALLRGEPVGLRSEFPVSGALPESVTAEGQPENGILISIYERAERPFAHTLQLVPRIVHVGVGCRRDLPPDRLNVRVEELLDGLGISRRAVASVASIDLKADEPAVLELARTWDVPAQFYTAAELDEVPGDFPPSAFVRKTTGTDNVCQRAAARASKNGRCLLGKTAGDGMTVSVYCEDWRTEF